MAARRIEIIKNHISPNKVSAESYQYTVDGKKLTKSQRDFYEKNGYLLIKGLIPVDIINRCRQRFLDICNGGDKGAMTLMKEINVKGLKKGEELYNKVQDILHDDVFSTYTEYPELLDYIECFTGPNIMGMHSMLINKPPGTSIHPPHQDLHYFPFRPANRIAASWTAMEPVFKSNGCLYVIPGSHKGELYHHSYPENEKFVNKAYHGIQNSDQVAPEEKRVYVDMDIGDTLFFHPILVHGSGLNTTNKFRKAISCHYASSECYYIETKGTTQENIAEEVVNMAKKRGWENSTFMEIWAVRGKNVRGEKINL